MRILYKISSDDNPGTFVKPYAGKDHSITWNREDERRYDFKKELKEITLVRDDYRHFHNINVSENRCDEQTIEVIMDCSGNEADYHVLFTGRFSMSNGQWDSDRCTVKFEIEVVDPYTCIEENDDDLNILELGNPQTVDLNITIGVETFVCTNAAPPVCNDEDLDNGFWGFYKQRYIAAGIVAKLYTRQYLLCPCDFQPSSGWTLLEACNNNQEKYIRAYVPSDTELYEIDSNLDVNGLDDPTESIDNGRRLLEVMQYLLNSACPESGLTIVSDFLQWNPENISSTNYVTQQTNTLTNLIIFQKSDVKRPNTSNNATKGETNFIDLLEQLCNTLNCGYKVIDNTFRIEHISWFESDLGIDLPAHDIKKLLRGTRKHSYDATRLPKYEKFEFMESGSADFVGTDIIYESGCVNNDLENKSTNSIESITTDVMHCLENPDPDSDVSDDGFVIVACDENNNILYQNGILEANTVVNNVLSWAHLHRDYWKHGRVLSSGEMNGQQTDFETTVPVIKQDAFNFIMNCNLLKLFNPLDKLKGTLGWGFVSSAELKLSQCTMKFELLLEEIDSEPTQQIYGDFDEDFSAEFD